jgi:histidine triad (HIT) family protein
VSCAFCEIVQGAKPSHVVFEDEVSIAFLDSRPLFPGHCLLIPRQHYETLPDVPPEVVGPLFLNAQLLCRAVEAAVKSDGSFVALNNRVSQSVPHLHIHVVPRRKKDGLKGFFWPRQNYKDDLAREAVRNAIEREIDKLQREQEG